MNIRRFDLEAQGLARVLGELEAKIIEIVWASGCTTVKETTERLGPDTSVKTVMTVMNRMVEKGLLHRSRSGRAFYYEATTDRETFMKDVVDRVLQELMADFRQPTLAHFIDTAAPEQLAELEELLRRRRSD